MIQNPSETLSFCRVLPVLTVNDPERAIRLCVALQRGGMRGVEITLRTPEAFQAIRAVKRTLPELTLAAGTVMNADAMMEARDAGADFAVSPGFTASLADCADAQNYPWLPGVATASETMAALERGLGCFKLFPAAALNGLDLLRSFAGPLARARFCPTGGLTLANFRKYLALPNVVCVGGSWMVPNDRIADEDWSAIERLCRETMNPTPE